MVVLKTKATAEQQILLDKLQASLPDLGKDAEFAGSLLKQAPKGLSTKQWFWVYKLADKLGAPDKAKPKFEVGNYAGVVALFAKAAQHLKNPKIHLSVQGHDIALWVSKKWGTVQVKDETGGIYVGYVVKGGVWVLSHVAYDNEFCGALIATLLLLGENPEKVAAEYGKLTGKCCFCKSTLSDEKSTDVGYGPICAKHYGLPWGEKIDLGSAKNLVKLAFEPRKKAQTDNPETLGDILQTALDKAGKKPKADEPVIETEEEFKEQEQEEFAFAKGI